MCIEKCYLIYLSNANSVFFFFQIIIFVVFKGTPATQPFFTNFIQNFAAIGTPLINAVRLNAQLYCKTEIKQTNLLLRLRFLSVNKKKMFS